MKLTLLRSIAGLSILAGIVLLGIAAFAPDVEISIPEAQARSELARQLPADFDSSGVAVTVTDASLDFLEDNRVSITGDFTAAADTFGLAGAGSLAATSSISYRGGEFYLADLSVEDITLTPNAASASKLGATSKLAGALVSRARDAISDGDAETSAAFNEISEAATIKLKAMTISHVNNILASTPVYSLNGKDMKHSLAAAALSDIRFSDTEAHVTLSPSKLALYVIGALLTIIAAIALGIGLMLAGPGVFFGVAMLGAIS